MLRHVDVALGLAVFGTFGIALFVLFGSALTGEIPKFRSAIKTLAGMFVGFFLLVLLLCNLP